MVELCQWATVHCIRFDGIETPGSIDLSLRPVGAASWKIGPDGPITPQGGRAPSEVWGGLALYRHRADAERAVDDPAAFMPFLAAATEHWHALLLPVAHRGACNHLDPAEPGLMIEASKDDPGGPLLVVTTAGFDIGPAFELERVIDFRRNVDRVRETIGQLEGNFSHQVFAPHVPGEDGITFTIWRDENALAAYAYRPGAHRIQVDRYKAEHTADRTSFTRFRALRTKGQWGGRCPVAAARAARASAQGCP